MSQSENAENIHGDESSPGSMVSQNPQETVDFPPDVLKQLEDQVLCRSRWVVPVLPGGELEVLMKAAIKLAGEGRDEENEHCQRFYKESMIQSYHKILADEASLQWRPEIHAAIYNSCKLLMELVALKINSDAIGILQLLRFALNPHCRFHTHNSSEKSNTCQQPNDLLLFAKPPSEGKQVQGWLVDFINWFGEYGGFDRLLQRFSNVTAALSSAKTIKQKSRHSSGASDPQISPAQSDNRQQSASPTANDLLSIQLISALLTPFSMCHKFLLPSTIQTYFLPIQNHLFQFFDSLSDQQIQKFSSTTPRNDGRFGDSLGSVLRCLRQLMLELPESEQAVTGLEDLRLRLIMRQLHSSTFSTKMAGLAELNRLATSQEEEYPAVERLTNWLSAGELLPVLLRDFLHLPQYIDRVEKLLRFMIRHKAIGAMELDLVWAAQTDQHEAIVKNVHDLLARLAWDFSVEQLDHFFGLIARAWSNATRHQQEQLLLLLKRLAEEDRDGQTAQKVLKSLWTMVREPAVSVLVLEQALACHAAVLEGCLMNKRDEVRWHWLMTFIDDIKREPISLALPELRQILAIIETWPQSNDMRQRINQNNESSRVDIIHRLRERYSIFDFLIDNLGDYMHFVRQHYGSKLTPDTMTDDRYDHVTQIKERLKLIRFLLQEGDVWLSDMHASKVWQTLAVGWVHSVDRDICFKWFSKLVANGPDMDPSTIGPFFIHQFLQLDPCLMTENGVACFRSFFHHVNKEQPLQQQQLRETGDEPFYGFDYLWRMVLQADDPAADSAAVLLRETLSEIALPMNFGPSPEAIPISVSSSVEMVAENFVERFRVAADSARPLITEADSDSQRRVAISRLLRVLTLIKSVIANTDAAFTGVRSRFPPLMRLCTGKQVRIRLRFATGSTSAVTNTSVAADECTYETNGNEQVAMLRQWASQKLGGHEVQLLRPGSSPLMQQDYAKVFDEAGILDGSLLIARVIPVSASASTAATTSNTNMGLELNDADSSDAECPTAGGDSGADSAMLLGNSGEGSVKIGGYGDETSLVSVKLARSPVFINRLLDVADWAPSTIRSATLLLLARLPASPDVMLRMTESTNLSEFIDCSSSTPVATFYNLKLMQALLCPVRGQPNAQFMERFIRTAVPSLLKFIQSETSWPADIFAQALVLISVTCGMLSVARLMASQHQATQSSKPHFEESDRQLQSILAVCPPLCFFSATTWGDYLLRQSLVDLPLSRTPGQEVTDLCVRVRDMAWSALFTDHLHSIGFDRDEHDETVGSVEISDEAAFFINDAVHCIVCLFLLNPWCAASIQADKKFQRFIVDLLLLCPLNSLRHSVATSLYNLSSNQECWQFLISMLFTTLGTISQPVYQERSYEFCDLICRLLALPSTFPSFEAGYWQKLLVDRWRAIEGMPASASSTFRDNQLAICAQLATLLTSAEKGYVATDEEGPQVLKALFEYFIFSPSIFLNEKSSSTMISSFSHTTIDSALNFAGRLCENSLPNLEYSTDVVVTCMGADPESLPVNEWEAAPAIGPRPPHGYVGLKNAGATCYMNSVLQQLFMLDPIRDAILSVSNSICGDPDPDNAEAQLTYNQVILNDLRTTFAFLLMADAQFYTPSDLWRHLRLNGESVNVREQHDALEFLHSLGDAVDEAVRGSLPKGVPPIIEKNLGGTFADLKICRDCPHRYSREETFTTLSVDVRNNRNLHESLDQYVRPDLLDGQNAYYCEQCEAKVTAVKLMCVRSLPSTLVIQLKRFDYDWERDCATKFNDYFEFPRQLDMEPYTEAGIARRDVGKPLNGSGDSGSSTPSDGETAVYNLIGVVVHSGQASGGHYYSFVKRKSDQKWFRFDDCDVNEASLDDDIELRNQCFGGEADPMMTAPNSGSMGRGMRRHRNYWNAYLLFYERILPFPVGSEPSEIANKVDSLTISNSSNINNASNESLSRYSPEVLPSPRLVSQVSIAPRLMQSVNEWNALAGHRRLHFSNGYFVFCRQLLLCCSSFQPTNSSDSLAAAACGLKLASRHLFELALRVRRQIRGNAVDLTDCCAKLLQRAHPEHRQAFLVYTRMLSPNKIWDFVVDCQSGEVRAAVARLVTSLIEYSLNDPPVTDEAIIDKWPLLIQEQARLGRSPGFLLATACISYMKKRDFADYVRHCSTLISICCDVTSFERRQLAVQLDLPVTLVHLMLDDTFSNAARHHQSDLAPICAALSTLLRSMDFSPLEESQNDKQRSENETNPYAETPFLGAAPGPILDVVGQVSRQNIVFPRRLTSWLQSTSEDITRLFQFFSWENWNFSSAAISVALQAMMGSGVGDCALYAGLIINLASIQDTWLVNRLEHLFHAGAGLTNVDSLPGLVEKMRQQQPRRAYLFLKVLVTILTKLPSAREVLTNDKAASRAFVATVDWLRAKLADSAELDPVPSPWARPLSNESSGGYYLEHSASARNILAKAMRLLPSLNVSECDQTLTHSPRSAAASISSSIPVPMDQSPMSYSGTANLSSPVSVSSSSMKRSPPTNADLSKDGNSSPPSMN